MKTTDEQSAIRHAIVSGHAVRSVVPDNEPERHRARALADLQAALPSASLLNKGGGLNNGKGRISAVVTTPDFHAGKPVPVGVVVDAKGIIMPHLIGNDIGCGMRMIVLEGITESDLGPDLERHLRHVHFQGGRDVALTGRDREAVLREGIPGLLESLGNGRKGLLAKLDMASSWKDVDRTSDDGFFVTDGVDADFADYADPDGGTRHDAILGTIGGGNHFVEFGVVHGIEDGTFAAAAGLRTGTVVLVVHSGSLDFGQRVGTAVKEKLHALRRPGEDERVLGLSDRPELARRYLNGLANAANAAFVNRLLIGLSAIEALERTVGRSIGHHLVYDAPHNTIWQRDDVIRHRKGACPARGPGALAGSPYEWLGEPVILPGSMGDGTWLLKGLGSAEGLESAAHGAGRRLSRGDARSQAIVPEQLRIVGPVDLKSPALRGRADIIKEVEGRLNEEAPSAYRPIESVVTPMVEAGLVGRVAKIRPVLTVKG
ncbi:RtcB family protein [Pararhizobium sp.]|uniref:RtcB family protein n=1 Tax=Pararhizobium sp. TaxID=1977563 RepID=UPI00271A056E|nr:RtcB family protein [Pararhizobium sp.]MDO9417165.1 RtcB family protein [Pararhizobium sp.]